MYSEFVRYCNKRVIICMILSTIKAILHCWCCKFQELTLTFGQETSEYPTDPLLVTLEFDIDNQEDKNDDW